MTISSRRLVPATVLALLASLLVTVPAQAAGTGTISGVVTARPTGGSASVYAGASVVFDRQTPNGTVSSSVQSAANGSFTATLPNGTYEIRTYPEDYGELGQYGYEYYDDRSGPYGATEVVVNDNATTLSHQIELQPIGKVVGTVRNEAGQPMPGVNVGFLEDNGGGYGTVTDAEGHYDSLEGQWSGNLIPGDYVVDVSSGAYGVDDPQYYYDTHPVTVSPGATTVQDITMRERPRVVFTVLDTDGTPLANAPLLFKVRKDGGAWDWPQYGPNETDAQGRYRFVDNFDEFKIQFGLPAGYQGTGVPEYWEDAYTFDAAKVLSFPDGVAKSRHYTVRLDPPTVVPPVVDPPVVNPPVVNPPVVVPPVVGALRTTRPRVVGAARLGRTLAVSVKAWSPAPVKLSFQWLRDGKPVKGRTARAYRVGKADVGHRISVRVVGRKASYATETVRSAATAKARR
jgi:hypothetical protein